MLGPFDSAGRKIARASEHFDHLEREIKAFIQEDPYKQIIEPDPDRAEHLLHKFKLTKELPASLPEIVGDVVSNMRDALDHAMYAVAFASGCPTPKEAYFPFAGTSERYEAAIKGRCRDVPQEIWPLLRTFQAYKGGNDTLFALNAVCNADKHTMLTPIGTAFLRPYTSVKGKGYWSMRLPEHSVWDRTKQEVVFLEACTDTELYYEIGFVFFVAFNEIEIVDGEPVLPVLDAFGGEVDRVLSEIEAESNRLGFT
jgi:hypothetical protein